jgi:hypothetical protein
MDERESQAGGADGQPPMHRTSAINRIVNELACAESWEQIARCNDLARKARRRAARPADG